MKNKLRYGFSRLIVLIVAIQMLDISIDIDHLTTGPVRMTAIAYDDTDSFSELLIEAITGDNNYVPETGNDDQSPFHKGAHKTHNFVFFKSNRYTETLPVVYNELTISTSVLFTSRLPQDVFSRLHCPPPELEKLAA